MSAGILEHDSVNATEPTWHGKEIIHKVIDFENSGLDWPVESGPIFGHGGAEIAGHQEIYSTGKEAEHIVLAVMKSRYTPILNKQIWEAASKALDGVAHVITCTGSLDNRKKVFISVRLTGKGNESFMVNGDKFLANLNFLSSHDGSMSFEVFDLAIRVVCQNTFNFARSTKCSGAFQGSARHTKNSQVKIAKIAMKINDILESRKIFIEGCIDMHSKPVSRDEAYAFAVGWGFPDHREKPSTMVIENANQIVSAFESGDGNNGKNRYDLFNGITQYFTRSTTRSDSDAYQSSFVGVGSNRKGEAFDILTDQKIFKSMVKNGERGLALVS